MHSIAIHGGLESAPDRGFAVNAGHGAAPTRDGPERQQQLDSTRRSRHLTLEKAAREMLHGSLQRLGGSGGIIAVDGTGRMVMDFSTERMFRGARDSEGRREVAIY